MVTGLRVVNNQVNIRCNLEVIAGDNDALR